VLANLRAALKLRNKRQREFCAEIGIGPSVFSEILAGRRPVEPWLQNKIAAVLEADHSWLFENFVSIPPLKWAESPNESTSGLAMACGGKDR
jgi:transcriptional regulator with XRE-family HTH domain